VVIERDKTRGKNEIIKQMIFKESEKQELKKATSELKEAVISIAAILNKLKKGELYFGINNDGTIIGQTIREKPFGTFQERFQSI
jgi:hypothetical protein